MRGFAVDERDSAWERDDPRFRVYAFEGPENAVTTVDLLDATVEEALEAARNMSTGSGTELSGIAEVRPEFLT